MHRRPRGWRDHHHGEEQDQDGAVDGPPQRLRPLPLKRHHESRAGGGHGGAVRREARQPPEGDQQQGALANATTVASWRENGEGEGMVAFACCGVPTIRDPADAVNTTLGPRGVGCLTRMPYHLRYTPWYGRCGMLPVAPGIGAMSGQLLLAIAFAAIIAVGSAAVLVSDAVEAWLRRAEERAAAGGGGFGPLAAHVRQPVMHAGGRRVPRPSIPAVHALRHGRGVEHRRVVPPESRAGDPANPQPSSQGPTRLY